MTAAARCTPLAELLPDVAGIPADLMVGGLCQDSREVRPGDAFLAIGEFGPHGQKYIEQARAAGAAVTLCEAVDTHSPGGLPDGVVAASDVIAVPGLGDLMGAMADRFFGQPSDQMDVVGVTGTNGKTTTVQLLVQAWEVRGNRAGSIGTLGAGLHGKVVPTGFTTPLVLKVHELLAQLQHDGARSVAMEVSSHALEQGRVDGVRFDVAVFTNLTRDHLDYHGDMATYGAAKRRLFGWAGLKAAAINLDDGFGRGLADSLNPSVRLVGLSSCGDAGATLRADAIRLDKSGIGFDLVLDAGDGEQRHRVQSSLLGRFNVDNLLAVAGALHALGDGGGQIADTLSQLQPVHGRMNRLGGEHGRPVVVIDYAHTPDALQQALASLRSHVAGRLVCVFGCGGERDVGKRPEMAAIAEAGADLVIVTDDNPRAEDGDAIVAAILAGFRNRDAIVVERDRRRAIERAVGEAGRDDIVLVAGKGHEPYQEVDGVRHPFDDTHVARIALEARP